MNNSRTLLLTIALLLALPLLGQAVKEHTIVNSLPLFLREGDRPQLNFILHNKKKKDWTGSSSLSLRDAKNKESVDGWFMNSVANQYFTVDSSNRYELLFPIEVPFLYNQELNWQLTLESGEDSITSKGSIPILSWPFEDSINAPDTKVSFVTVNKKIQASNPIRRGQKILIDIEIAIKKSVESLVIVEEWAAGLLPEKGALQLSGTINNNFSENRNTKSCTIQFTNLAAGTYHLRYYAVASFPGVFNHPPTLLYLNGASSYSARSSYEKLAIE